MLYVVCYHVVKMIHDQKPGTEEHFVEFKVVGEGVSKESKGLTICTVYLRYLTLLRVNPRNAGDAW